MISKLKYDYLLGFIAVCWGLLFSFVLQLQPEFNPLGDDVSYLYSAKLLYVDHQLDNTRPLLISALHGIPYLFGGTDQAVIHWGLLLNFISWFATVLLVFALVADRHSRKMAFVVAVLFMLCIGNLAHAFRFLSETMYIFMLVAAVYYTNKYDRTKQATYISLAIALLLLNALIKPVSLGLAVVFTAFYIFKIKSIFLNAYAPILFGSALLVLFQMYTLKKQFGDFTISYIGAITYYNYIGAKSDCYQKGIDYLPGKNERAYKTKHLPSHEAMQLAQADFSDQLKNNKFNLCKAYLFCMYSNSSKGNYIVSECKNEQNTVYFGFFRWLFKAISKCQTVFFTLSGLVISFYLLLHFKKTNSFYVLMALTILYIFFISAMSCFECDRFHIAFYPLVLVMLVGVGKKPLDIAIRKNF
ncbi:MAG: hypothetical protein CFE24_12765 [Flavobacterium sp. BFFFF2]|nr:MAG: hypothetical protein CFE24_12765 [Flavobacterium sp. BFFFF2]